MKHSKKERQRLLKDKIASDPFITDESLAELFKVSVQTIRLDRLELSIPELRERMKHAAREHYDEVKALAPEEVIGEIIDLQLDKEAISILDIKEEHVFYRNDIARGHFLFAQANSLAVAIINDELALTNKASVNFMRQVKIGERVVARAVVTEAGKAKTLVEVTSKVNREVVFRGEFTMYRSRL
ncbi:transcription factor FapR [Alteribacillus iranensis]|uniref:Transcription factor FapR n=1 Tax=Alteribacillus iranensis TaxID=930128 RepID=A0A1I2A7U3_9BACI|nr:transcription factor FapR [Alteribacillus iranensis]SFE39789.1 Acyl-coenzyme A thioesterase PaaI, contains HGG motif [Alteribacillus iranensis]